MLQEPIQLARLFQLMFDECLEISLQDLLFFHHLVGEEIPNIRHSILTQD